MLSYPRSSALVRVQFALVGKALPFDKFVLPSVTKLMERGCFFIRARLRSSASNLLWLAKHCRSTNLQICPTQRDKGVTE